MPDDPSTETPDDDRFSPDDLLDLIEEVETVPAPSVPDASGAVEGDIDVSDVDVVALLDERNQFLDAYRRSQADFENFRKQAHKRQSDEVTRVLGRFVEGLLPVLDAGDAAMIHGAEGATEVFAALLGALEKEGLERVDPLGEPFDPKVAEAVMHEPGEGGEQVVAEVLRVGYLWNDRVLRPAMVKVKG